MHRVGWCRIFTGTFKAGLQLPTHLEWELNTAGTGCGTIAVFLPRFIASRGLKPKKYTIRLTVAKRTDKVFIEFAVSKFSQTHITYHASWFVF